MDNWIKCKAGFSGTVIKDFARPLVGIQGALFVILWNSVEGTNFVFHFFLSFDNRCVYKIGGKSIGIFSFAREFLNKKRPQNLNFVGVVSRSGYGEPHHHFYYS